MLVKGITELRRRLQRAPAADISAAPSRSGWGSRKQFLRMSAATSTGWRCFWREWQKKSATSRLAESGRVSGLLRAGRHGQVNLEQEADDAVQLMTVHAAKGLEFDNVYVLRLTQGAFPNRDNTAVLGPRKTCGRSEGPHGNFHTQEERLPAPLLTRHSTRARERLTLTTVVHKRSKPSVFLDDILL